MSFQNSLLHHRIVRKLLMNSTLFLRLGENNLDMDAVQVIADVLQVSESITNLG